MKKRMIVEIVIKAEIEVDDFHINAEEDLKRLHISCPFKGRRGLSIVEWDCEEIKVKEKEI